MGAGSRPKLAARRMAEVLAISSEAESSTWPLEHHATRAAYYHLTLEMSYSSKYTIWTDCNWTGSLLTTTRKCQEQSSVANLRISCREPASC